MPKIVSGLMQASGAPTGVRVVQQKRDGKTNEQAPSGQDEGWRELVSGAELEHARNICKRYTGQASSETSTKRTNLVNQNPFILALSIDPG